MALEMYGKYNNAEERANDKPRRKAMAKEKALKKKTEKNGFDHEQHHAHNQRIEEIDKKFGIHHSQRPKHGQS